MVFANPIPRAGSAPVIDPNRGRQVPPPPGADSYRGIPRERGWPLFGHTLEFLNDSNGMTARLAQAHGANFLVRLFGRPMVLIGDPDGVRTVLLDRGRNFSSCLGWSNSLGELFARGLILRDFADHRRHRKIMQVAFRTEAMQAYTDRMNDGVALALTRWAECPEFRLYPEMKKATLDMAAEVFLGIALGPESDRVNQALAAAVQASVAVIKTEFWGLTYRHGMNGRRVLERFLTEKIPERRRRGGDDLFSQLCCGTTEDGERFTDQEIVDHMIFLLMAAHDTTTSALSAVVYHLTEDLPLQDRLRQTCLASPSDRIGWEDRGRFTEIEWTFKEAVRMHPPIPFILRRVLDPCRVGDLSLPAHGNIAVCALTTHFLQDYWRDPYRFDIDRFSPARAEDKQHSHIYYPFGGGAHMCLGMHFAMMQVKVFLHHLLRRYEVRRVDDRPVHWGSVPIPRPQGGLPVRLSAQLSAQ